MLGGSTRRAVLHGAAVSASEEHGLKRGRWRADFVADKQAVANERRRGVRVGYALSDQALHQLQSRRHTRLVDAEDFARRVRHRRDAPDRPAHACLHVCERRTDQGFMYMDRCT